MKVILLFTAHLNEVIYCYLLLTANGIHEMAELSNSSLSLDMVVLFLSSMLLPDCALVTDLVTLQNTTVILQLIKVNEKCSFVVTVLICTSVVT